MPLAILIGLVGLYFVFRARVENTVMGALSDSLTTTLTGIVNGQTVEIDCKPIGQVSGRLVYLRADAADSFLQMQADASKDSVSLLPSGARAGMRTVQDTIDLANEEGIQGQGGLAAKPGKSKHLAGTELDITVHSSADSAEYQWLAANADRYGWINTGKDFPTPELWHWHFQGGNS